MVKSVINRLVLNKKSPLKAAHCCVPVLDSFGTEQVSFVAGMHYKYGSDTE